MTSRGSCVQQLLDVQVCSPGVHLPLGDGDERFTAAVLGQTQHCPGVAFRQAVVHDGICSGGVLQNCVCIAGCPGGAHARPGYGQPAAIQTMLKRLVTKKALTYEKQSRVFVYTPLVPETEYIRQESNSFLNKYYNGNIVSMLTSYLEDDKLSKTELDTLRHLLSDTHE